MPLFKLDDNLNSRKKLWKIVQAVPEKNSGQMDKSKNRQMGHQAEGISPKSVEGVQSWQ